jgi:outer membrane protein, heavy metal efflux system
MNSLYDYIFSKNKKKAKSRINEKKRQPLSFDARALTCGILIATSLGLPTNVALGQTDDIQLGLPVSSVQGPAGEVMSRQKLAALQPELRGPIASSLSIDQAMNETLMQSPRAASLRLQLGIAKSGVARATELPNPSIFMDNGYKAEFTYRYGVSVPIEPPWKLALRLLAAKKQIALADLQIAKGLWVLRGDIRRTYAAALIAQERYETLSELTKLYKRLLSSAEIRFKSGDVAQLDVYRAELAYQRALINRNLAMNQVKRAKQGLSVLLGREYDSSFDVPRLPPFILKAKKLDYLPDLLTNIPEISSLLPRAFQNRLEIKIVEQSIKTNGANLKLAYGNILPNPTIGAGSSVVNGPPLPQNAGPNDRNNFHGFFFQASVPLPIFSFQQGDITQYKAVIKQLQAEQNTQKNAVEQEVVEAYQAVIMQRQKIQSFQENALARSHQIAQMTQRSYEIGQSDIASVLIAQQANVEIRNEYLDAVYAYEIAYTDLEQAIGTTLY